MSLMRTEGPIASLILILVYFLQRCISYISVCVCIFHIKASAPDGTLKISGSLESTSYTIPR